MRINSMVFNYLKHYKNLKGIRCFSVMTVELPQYDILAIVKKLNNVTVTNVILKFNFRSGLPRRKRVFYSANT